MDFWLDMHDCFDIRKGGGKQASGVLDRLLEAHRLKLSMSYMIHTSCMQQQIPNHRIGYVCSYGAGGGKHGKS